MIVGQLEVLMMANVGRLVSEMDRAKSVVGNTMSGIDKAVGVAKAALGALGVGLSVNYFAGMIKNSINAQDELSKMAQRINVSVEGLAGLGHAASLSGTSLGAVEKALKTVSQQMLDAQRGLTASQENFSALGISVVDSTGALRSADAVMIDVADRFAQMEDGVQKTALATKLFGKSGLELIPMLNEGSAGLAELVAEGKRYNPVTAASAKQAELFNDNLDRVRGAMGSVTTVLVNKMLPALANLSQRVVNFVNSDQLGVWMDRITVAGGALALVMTAKMVPAMGAVVAQFLAATGQSIAYQSALASMAGLSGTAAIAQTGLATATTGLKVALSFLTGPAGLLMLGAGAIYLLIQRQKEAAETADLLSTRFDKVRASLGALTQNEVARAVQAEFEHMNALKKKQAQLQVLFETQGMYEDELRVLNLQVMEAESNHGMLVRQLERVKDGWKPVTAETIAATEATKATAKATMDATAAARQFALMMDNTEDAYVALMGIQDSYISKTDIVTTRTTRLTDAQRGANLTNLDAQDSIDGIVESMTAQEVASESMTRVTELMRDDISSAFADMMMSGENAFDAIAKSFERMIYKMIADWAASKIMNMVTGTFTGGGSGGGGGSGVAGSVVSSVIGKGVSSAASSIFGGGAAAAAGGTAAGAGAGAGISGMISSAGSAIAGGAQAIGAGAMNVMAAIPGWGWAIAGAALVAKLLDDSGTMSSNAGLLLHDVPGASSDRKFQVAPFASGIAPVGFARRDSQDNAMKVIDAFRAVDSAIAEIFAASGTPLNASAEHIRGFSETGTGTGVYFGSAAEDGSNKGMPLDQQLSQYAYQLIDSGFKRSAIEDSKISMISRTAGVEGIMAQLAETLGVHGSHASGLAYVPFDGYRAELHKGESVLTAQQTRSMQAENGRLAAEIAGMRQALMDIGHQTRRTADFLLRVTRDGESIVTVAA